MNYKRVATEVRQRWDFESLRTLVVGDYNDRRLWYAISPRVFVNLFFMYTTSYTYFEEPLNPRRILPNKNINIEISPPRYDTVRRVQEPQGVRICARKAMN